MIKEVRFGNWIVGEDGITWDGLKKKGYYIEKDSLKDVLYDYQDVYEWPIYIVDKSWINKSDIYTFNTAFVFALVHFGIGFSQFISISKTFLRQQWAMEKSEESEEESLRHRFAN